MRRRATASITWRWSKGLGCKAIRVSSPNEIQAAFAQAKTLMDEYQVPVVIEVMLERVTNIAMGTEIDAIVEFEELAERGEDAPTAIAGAARLIRERRKIACRNLPPTSPCSSPRCPSSTASRAPPRPASTAVEYLFPYDFDAEALKAALERQRPEPGAAQPAGRQLGRRRARHRLPARPRRRVPRRRRRGHRLRDGAGLHAGQLPGRHGAGRRDR